jgi:tetratricopeptide (TPR) repeat protein
MKLSDSECSVLLAKKEYDKLGQDEIYKACVLTANNGGRIDSERFLKSSYVALLDARRMLKSESFEAAKVCLESFSKQSRCENTPIWLEGDQKVIKALIYQRSGDYNNAIKEMQSASDIFQKENEVYRRFRALINSEILKCDYSQFIDGNLYFLQKSAYQEGFNDLVGHIHKARSVELLNRGLFSESVTAAIDALGRYDIQAPDAEDQAVAQCLVSLSYFLLGNLQSAREWLSRVLVRDGKVKYYFEAINSMIAGRVPIIPITHPLNGTPWKSSLAKSNSITGKLVGCLQLGPSTRDQLITYIWGENTLDPSYCDRLYSAIKQVRKKMGMTIIFDGTYYCLK